ncbi:TPA: DUF551 domain-containing protein [Klebsiella pneumoniae]|nr:DUF551 domain-containing protein [Klebsiella pneumoniae]HED1472176.1 DUF551 domain-containing protein [Klebsiella pneumoniae]
MKFEEWLSQQNGVIEVDCGCVTTEAFYHWMRVAYEAGSSPVIPEGSASMLRRWLAFGRGMQSAGSQLPHNLIAETESMLAASPQPQNSPQNIPEIIPGWIPVSERLPENDGAYLCWDNRYVTTYAFIFGAWQANQFVAKNITHWMPLPNPPKE